MDAAPTTYRLPCTGQKGYNGGGDAHERTSSLSQTDVRRVRELLLTSLRLSCLLLFCAYLMLVHTGAMSPDNVTLYRTARLLYQQPASIFLLGCLGSYLLEQRSRRC